MQSAKMFGCKVRQCVRTMHTWDVKAVSRSCTCSSKDATLCTTCFFPAPGTKGRLITGESHQLRLLSS